MNARAPLYPKVGTLKRLADGTVGVAREDGSDYNYASTGPGWSDLLLELDATLALVSPGTHYVQIKEKFGGLRVYTSGMTPDGIKAMQKADKKAYETCEMCGQPGELRDQRRWVLTLCDSCDNKKKPALT